MLCVSRVGVVLCVVLLSVGCARDRAPVVPIVAQVEMQTAQKREGMPVGESPQIAQVVVDRERVTTEEFLYGADLQRSTSSNEDLELYDQSVVWGHVPARFRIIENELQLVALQLTDFPGDYNHPERLLSRIEILEMFTGTDGRAKLKLKVARSGVQLARVAKILVDKGAGAPLRDSWVRSFEYAQDGEVILQQTSVILSDGTVAEFLESIFPAKNLAPSPSFETIPLDESGRFGFLPGDKIRTGEGREEQVEYAVHYDLGKDIDWYVSANTPEELLAPIGAAIEGWNRYFVGFEGIAREVVKFKGRLPAGIHIGDPRFNVVVWDSRLVAGAAYESQAQDSRTGKQSHSLIYLPAAWLAIGKRYWSDGRAGELAARSLSDFGVEFETRGTGASGSRRRCTRDLRDAASAVYAGTLADGLSTDAELREFSIQLLKQTLFHEVGHALGMDHNFKGSLTFPTTSIMDYNAFDLERFAFDSVEASTGPVLEYDRQVLSTLYNGAKDVSDEDAVLPNCNDEDADALAGGIDPLCMRYDQEVDPSRSIEGALARLENTDLGVDKIAARFLTPAVLEGVDTQDKFEAQIEQLKKIYLGHLRFFVGSSNGSMLKTLKVGARGLLEFQADSFTETEIKEGEFRSRVWGSVTRALAMRKLSDTIWAAVDRDILRARDHLKNTPYFKAHFLTDEQQTEWGTQFVTQVREQAKKIESEKLPKGLVQAQVAIIGELARSLEVPFYFGTLDGTELDFEKEIVTILVPILISELDRTQAIRMAAATTLASFKGRRVFDRVRGQIRRALEAELTAAKDNKARENSYALLKAISI